MDELDENEEAEGCCASLREVFNDEKNYMVEHTLFNFWPMIKKMKIDLWMDKKFSRRY